MASSFLPSSLQNLWYTWNIRGFMILSLVMQLVLALVAPLRMKTANRFVIFVVWSAYILADWSAIFVFGLITNSGCRKSVAQQEVREDLLAIWAAFLLVHLGGPDNITAFSMEDNALWPRHLASLVAQLSAFFYIFLKTIPNNRLIAPTVLISVIGVIKYEERTRELYILQAWKI